MAASHLVVGYWPKGTPRTDIDMQVQALVAMAPISIRDMMARPRAPKAYGRIAKVKAQRPLREKVAFEMSRIMERSARPNGPSWVSVERSPEVGARTPDVRRLDKHCEDIRRQVRGRLQ